MYQHEGHWIAHSLSDLTGWTVIAMEGFKPGVFRLQISRQQGQNGAVAEMRTVYLAPGLPRTAQA